LPQRRPEGATRAAGVALGDAAEQLDLDAPTLGSALASARAAAAARTARAPRGPPRDGGTFTAVVTVPPGERRDDLLGGLEARAVGGLGGRGAQVRGDDDLG
jgi:hypothetical protein